MNDNISSGSSLREKVQEGVYALGKVHESGLVVREEMIAINCYLCACGADLVQEGGQVATFKRVQLGKTTYYSEAYTRVQKRSTVVYMEEGRPQFALVQKYIIVGTFALALVRDLVPCDQFPFIQGIDAAQYVGLPALSNTVVVKRGNMRAIPVRDIKEKCCLVEIADLRLCYVVRFPSTMYSLYASAFPWACKQYQVSRQRDWV